MQTRDSGFFVDSKLCYLFVGGFGGLGKELVKWMISVKDLKSAALVGRSGAREEDWEMDKQIHPGVSQEA